ncbi:MAG: O-antigen ligase family protein, partial [Desulfomonilaceae bacterium]
GKATGTGSFAAAGLPLVLWKVRWSQGRSRVFFLFVLGVLLYLLIFSGGRAAIIGGLAAFIVWTWKHWRSGRLAIFLTVSAIMFLFVSGVLSLDMLPDYIVREESLPTFTGRIPRWKVGLQLFMESPILGHGYGMTRYVRMYEEGERLTGVIVPGQVTLLDVIPGFGTARLGRMTLHSDHVERLMEMGILGYVPFALFWFFILRRIARVFWLPITYESSLTVALALNVAYVFLDSFMHGALFAINAPGVLIAWFGIATFMAATEKLQVYPRANLCVSSTSSTALTPAPAVLAIR